ATPHAFVGPTRVPERIARVVEIGMAAEPENFALAGPASGIGTAGIMPGLLSIADAPPPPQPKPAPQKSQAPSAPVTVGGGVQSAKLVFGTKPPYPPLARASRTQGTVKLQAIIAADGFIRRLQVVSGPPLLTKAAVDAVQQWRYQPTLLNGTAVEVIT